MYKTLSSPDVVEPLRLGEIIRAQVFRPLPGGGYPDEGEDLCVGDLIITTGLNYIASRVLYGDSTASAMAYMAVGTVTDAATYTDTTVTGEVSRKSFSGSATSNLVTLVGCWGGSADSVTSLSIGEAGVFNHASSGQGTMYQRVTFSTWTPANSDVLKLILQTNVGSR